MNPQQQPQNPYPRSAGSGVTFDSLSAGFNMVSKNFAPFALAALGVFGPMAIAGAIGYFLVLASALAASSTSNNSVALGGMLVSYLLMFVIILAGAAVGGPGFVSIARMAGKLYRGESISNDDAFWAWKNRLVPSMVLALIVGIATGLGVIACYIGALIVGALLSGSFAALATDDSLAPMDAVKKSMEAFKPSIVMACLLFLVAGFIGGLGSYVCGIGALFTYPIFIATMAHAYFSVTGTPAASAPMDMPTPTDPM
jgi:uncharacterized membrane protein